MRMFPVRLVISVIVLGLISPGLMAQVASVRADKVEVVAVKPDKGDVIRINHALGQPIDAPVNQPVYVVKVFLNPPALPAAAQPFDFYLGDRRIEKYSSFKGGIFFKVFTEAELRALAGAILRVKPPGETIQDLGVLFPPYSAAGDKGTVDIDRLPTLKAALRD